MMMMMVLVVVTTMMVIMMMVLVVVMTMLLMVIMMMMMMMIMITMLMMLKDRYVDKHQMRRYHDSIILSCVSYSENTFSHWLTALLDGLSCPIDNDAS